MKYRPFCSTGFEISEIGFGCGDNGGLMVEGSPDERLEVVGHALAAGINYFDTSNNYGDGKSEANLGATLRELGAHPFVATKVRLTSPDLDDLAAGVRSQFEASRERLGMETIDLYYLHTRVASERRIGANGISHVSLDDLMGPIWETFAGLREEGKVRFLGICTSGAEVPAIRRALNELSFDVVQSSYSMLNPTEGQTPLAGFQGQDFGQNIELAGAKGMGVVAYRVLAAGALAQRAGSGLRPSPSRGNAGWDADIERAAALGFLRADGQEKLAGPAVRYALANQSVSTVILGFSKRAYVDEAVAYSEAGPLSADAIERIEELYASDFGRTH